MALSWKQFKTKALLFLAVLGPGIITAVADNDAAGVATYSVAASLYGMSSQYLVLLVTMLLAITQEIGARMAIVTGKGLGDLIREHYGVRVSVAIFIAYFFVNQAVVLQDVSGLKSAIQLFHLPWQPILILTCAAVVLAVVLLKFRTLQRIFLCTIIFYAVYVFSAVIAHPDWGQAFRESLVAPRANFAMDLNYWFAIIAVFGTTVTAWGQFFVQSFIADKGLKPHQLPLERAEVYTGAFLTNFFSWMIAAAVTYTLFVNNIEVVDGLSAALAIQPMAGSIASAFFAVGLAAASFLGLTIVPLATAYVFGELFGFERTLDATFVKGRLFYTFFILQVSLGLLISLFPNVSLFGITLYANYLSGALVPVVFFFLLKFSGDKKIMGERYVTRGFSRFFLQLSTVVIIFAVVMTLFGGIFFR
ncbi:MAG: divalent metal cation transporter [Patescibacteria group bacterium]|nr:divalent metal cation transporter [Patescibacteria group bacterium]